MFEKNLSVKKKCPLPPFHIWLIILPAQGTTCQKCLMSKYLSQTGVIHETWLLFENSHLVREFTQHDAVIRLQIRKPLQFTRVLKIALVDDCKNNFQFS